MSEAPTLTETPEKRQTLNINVRDYALLGALIVIVAVLPVRDSRQAPASRERQQPDQPERLRRHPRDRHGHGDHRGTHRPVGRLARRHDRRRFRDRGSALAPTRVGWRSCSSLAIGAAVGAWQGFWVAFVRVPGVHRDASGNAHLPRSRDRLPHGRHHRRPSQQLRRDRRPLGASLARQGRQARRPDPRDRRRSPRSATRRASSSSRRKLMVEGPSARVARGVLHRRWRSSWAPCCTSRTCSPSTTARPTCSSCSACSCWPTRSFSTARCSVATSTPWVATASPP